MPSFTNVYKPDQPLKSYACPCCLHRTLHGRGNYEICPVCYWEDDGQDDHDADVVRGGPNCDWSLTASRLQYSQTGACRPEDLPHVRQPLSDELLT